MQPFPLTLTQTHAVNKVEGTLKSRKVPSDWQEVKVCLGQDGFTGCRQTSAKGNIMIPAGEQEGLFNQQKVTEEVPGKRSSAQRPVILLRAPISPGGRRTPSWWERRRSAEKRPEITERWTQTPPGETRKQTVWDTRRRVWRVGSSSSSRCFKHKLKHVRNKLFKRLKKEETHCC